MTIQTRQDEIKAIHGKYQDFYRIGGALTIVLILIVIGSWIFGQNAFDFESDFLGYITNVATELLSVVGTVIVVDQLNRWRATQERKRELFDQVKSRSNDMAVDALEKIQRAEWLDDMLKYHLNMSGNSDLSHVKWSGGVNLERANLQKADLRDANLEGAKLSYANLEGASLWGINLQEAGLRETNLREASLWEANLREADLLKADMQKAYLRDADLQQANLIETNLYKADLKATNLRESHLNNSNLSESNLVFANLQNAGLGGANLEWANLTSANLQNAGLEKADLQQADLVGTNLQGVYLHGSNLQGADLHGSNLQGAKLNDKTLFNTKTILPDATFQGFDTNIQPIYTKYWTSDTDMTRYTNPDHPDFWQPDWAKKYETG